MMIMGGPLHTNEQAGPLSNLLKCFENFIAKFCFAGLPVKCFEIFIVILFLSNLATCGIGQQLSIAFDKIKPNLNML